MPEVYTAKAVHERFLSAPGLRLVPDGGIVRQTILKALADGKIVLRLEDGRAYDAEGCVEGSDGKRRRIPGSVSTFPLDDTVLITRPNTFWGKAWLAEDRKVDIDIDVVGDPPIPIPPRTPDRIALTSWEKILLACTERPLLGLQLIVPSPAAAASLVTLAQPLGAENIGISVTVSGTSKAGGSINFAATDLKINHPVKPLQIAQTLYNALGTEATYEADLALQFGADGRTGLEEQLRALSEQLPEGANVSAEFGKPLGDNQ
jgi:hypothetical protein